MTPDHAFVLSCLYTLPAFMTFLITIGERILPPDESIVCGIFWPIVAVYFLFRGSCRLFCRGIKNV